MHNDIQFCLHCLRDQFWAQTLDGLTLGAVYALIALGYTLVYGVLRLINFAHSEIFMIGIFVSLFTLHGLGMQPADPPRTGLRALSPSTGGPSGSAGARRRDRVSSVLPQRFGRNIGRGW